MAFSDFCVALLLSPSLFLLGPFKKQGKSRNKQAQEPSPQSHAQRMIGAALGRGGPFRRVQYLLLQWLGPGGRGGKPPGEIPHSSGDRHCRLHTTPISAFHCHQRFSYLWKMRIVLPHKMPWTLSRIFVNFLWKSEAACYASVLNSGLSCFKVS